VTNLAEGGRLVKFRTLLIINTIVVFVYGIILLLSPATMLSLHGTPQDSSGKLLGQYFGTALIAIGLMTWFARDISDSRTHRAIRLAMMISNTFGVIVSVLGTVNGVMSAMGWSAAAVYLVMGLSFAYFQFAEPGAS
jgi:hypothetical protein